MFGLNFRQIFMLTLLAAAIFVATRVGPAYYHSFQFADLVQQDVKFAVASRKSTEEVRAEIIDQATEGDIPLGRKDIHITRRGPAFTVDLDYILPLEFRIYHYDWKFHVTASGEIFDK